MTPTNPALIRAQLEELRGRMLAIAGEDALEDQKLWHDTLDGSTDALDQLREILRSALADEALAEGLAIRQKRMTDRKERLKRRAQVCRDMAKECMGILGLRKLEAPDFTASVGAGRPSVKITNPFAIPSEFTKVNIEPRKDQIADALKRGVEVPGAELGNAEPILRISQA